jgi:hypothetical protein
MNKREKKRFQAQQVAMAIDYLERQQEREMSQKEYDKRSDEIMKLNNQLKELSK